MDKYDIDDAIKWMGIYQHNEEENANYWAETYGNNKHPEQEVCEKRAGEYRQLIKWLNELKEFRKKGTTTL